ncbi:unnamed protein product [Ranitomeya imitator]|uniref:rhomboid protease n=1 Tax=Ranitomeya imitator TaxID=111125 RepID=A0ABN9MEC7_9NEOB|nr:unnamed protein product [Ranitomeya imitator]
MQQQDPGMAFRSTTTTMQQDPVMAFRSTTTTMQQDPGMAFPTTMQQQDPGMAIHSTTTTMQQDPGMSFPTTMQQQDSGMAAALRAQCSSRTLTDIMNNMELEGMADWADETEEPEKDPPPLTCWEKFHTTISNWMLPPDHRITYMERANCLPPPIFIISISIIELGVFIYYAVWMPQKQWITLDSGINNSPFIYRPDKREEAWRFASYMLVHAGVQHIIGNLFLQLFLGIPLEMVHKGHRVGLVYIAGVLGGSLASSIFDPHLALVGASGGVYALIGGYFMNIIVFGFIRPYDILSILFWIIQMLSSKLQMGPDMYWLKQGDMSSTAGSESLEA